jgi:hypothetical protein
MSAFERAMLILALIELLIGLVKWLLGEPLEK